MNLNYIELLTAGSAIARRRMAGKRATRHVAECFSETSVKPNVTDEDNDIRRTEEGEGNA